MIKKKVIAVKAANNNTGATTGDETKEAKKIMQDKFLAALMLSGVNRDRYGDLKRSMAENYVKGTSKHPKSPEVVLCILSAYVSPAGWNRRVKQGGGGKGGAMFAQSVDDSWKNNITCYKCEKKGHFSRECRSKGDGEKLKSQENNHVHANVDKDNDDEVEENLFVQHKKPKIGGPVGPLPTIFFSENSSLAVVLWSDDTSQISPRRFLTSPPSSTPSQSSPICRSSREDICPLAQWICEL
jgi:hypothetical protein